MPKIDVAAVPERKGSGYPKPFDAPCAERIRKRLGNAGGLTDFGVNLMRLPPGGWSSQRHWHSHEDEFVYLLEGSARFGADGSRAAAGQVLWFEPDEREGASEILVVADERTRAIFWAGGPLREPVAARGPFVMNTPEELLRAYADYSAGRF